MPPKENFSLDTSISGEYCPENEDLNWIFRFAIITGVGLIHDTFKFILLNFSFGTDAIPNLEKKPLLIPDVTLRLVVNTLAESLA